MTHSTLEKHHLEAALTLKPGYTLGVMSTLLIHEMARALLPHLNAGHQRHSQVAEHIRHLEFLIEEGAKLRDDMRRSAEQQTSIINRQSSQLKQLSSQNELYRIKRSQAAQRLHKARCNARSLEAKLKKQLKRYDEQEVFYAAIKKAANDMGVWKELVGKAKENINAD